MATSREWAEGFFDQAAEDLNAVQILLREGGPASTSCMLLQMIFEKLFKAAALRAASDDTAQIRQICASHAAADRVSSRLRHHPQLERMEWLGQGNRHQFHLTLDWVKALEKLHPAFSRDNPFPGCLEYPEEDPSGKLWLPKEVALVQQFADPRKHLCPFLLSFAQEFQRNFNQLFP